jgi:hypothetical protein
VTKYRLFLCIGRRARGALAASLLLLTGCPSVPDSGHRSYNPVGGVVSKISGKGQSQDEDLRKKVEADKFPTAKQAGIAG